MNSDSENGFPKGQFTTVYRVLWTRIRGEAAKKSQKQGEPFIIAGGVGHLLFFFLDNEVLPFFLHNGALAFFFFKVGALAFFFFRTAPLPFFFSNKPGPPYDD